MKSVLFVIPELSNGGAERVVVNIANGIAEKGTKVGILTYRSGGDYENQVNGNIQLYSLNQRVKTINEKILAIKYLVSVSLGYDNIVSALELFTDEIVYWCKVVNKLRKGNKKYHAMVHIALSSYPKFTKKKKHKIRMSYIYKKFDSVIAVSNGVKNDLNKILGLKSDNIKVIYNPVDVNTIISKKDEWVDVHRYSPCFISIGRLSEQKDHETLIRAFEIFLKNNVKNEYHLLILGRGPLEDKLKKIVEEIGISQYVHFLGFKENPWKYLRCSTGFVSTSVFEGFSLVIAEAMACKTPVIATDCPYGPSELIQENKNGYLVKMKNISQIADNMKRIVERPDEAKVKVENAFDYINQKFDISKVTDIYLELLNK